MKALGGLRRPRADSHNSAWNNLSFRGYADYLATEAFADGLMELAMLAGGLRTAIMCAEAVWWRCHRRIVADYLLAEGVLVKHIMGLDKVDTAVLTPGARLQQDGTLLYCVAGEA